MKYVIANFKSHKSLPEYQSWLDAMRKTLVGLPNNIHLILAPSYPAIPLFAAQLASLHLDNVSLAVQDVSPFPAGAYTGAVSTLNIAELAVSYALVGHSERRTYFHETHQEIANKIAQCTKANITPILCVTRETLVSQATTIEQTDLQKLWIAFEPEGSIGTGMTDSLEDILDTQHLVATHFGQTPYIYGGSVHHDIDPAIFTHPDIHGYLVGTAALQPETLIPLLENIQHLTK